jgi:hypothetical protein
MVNAVLLISYGGHLRFSTVWVWYNCVLLIFSLLDNQWSCAMSGSCNCYKECLVLLIYTLWKEQPMGIDSL